MVPWAMVLPRVPLHVQSQIFCVNVIILERMKGPYSILENAFNIDDFNFGFTDLLQILCANTLWVQD